MVLLLLLTGAWLRPAQKVHRFGVEGLGFRVLGFRVLGQEVIITALWYIRVQ